MTLSWVVCYYFLSVILRVDLRPRSEAEQPVSGNSFKPVFTPSRAGLRARIEYGPWRHSPVGALTTWWMGFHRILDVHTYK